MKFKNKTDAKDSTAYGPRPQFLGEIVYIFLRKSLCASNFEICQSQKTGGPFVITRTSWIASVSHNVFVTDKVGTISKCTFQFFWRGVMVGGQG